MTEVIKSLLKVAIKLERHLGASAYESWEDRASYSNDFKAKTAQIRVNKTPGGSKRLGDCFGSLMPPKHLSIRESFGLRLESYAFSG
jgi:hypothetical protein